MKKAIALFAHGSRDPLWHRPMEAVASQIRVQSPDTLVVCAYLELSPPDLPTVIGQLVADDVGSVRIVPLFLGVGRHAREDLPKLVADLRVQYPSLHLHLDKAVGEDPRLVQLLANIALEGQ
ncbi:MAG: cobalamin biosynthesis protein CbiX [Burkholderiales bacterium PBB4]|nr:MAG: cobalamin biosynthesis protein CbiX [Burkholderiales bacterium PBB4]